MGTLQKPEKEKAAGAKTSKADMKSIARSIYDNFNARKIEESAQWVADDCEWLDVSSGAAFHGPTGYIDFEKGWLTAFPDGKVEVTNMIVNSDLVATEFIGRGTHKGPLMGATGDSISATGQPVEVRCVEVMQFKGGKIARVRFYIDALSMLRQIGALK